MAIYDVYWKRAQKSRGEVPDVFVYDQIPSALRVQVVQIMHDTLGDYNAYWAGTSRAENIKTSYRIIVDILSRELGVFTLDPNSKKEHYLAQVTNYILKEQNTEHVLGAIELVCRLIVNRASRMDYRGFSEPVKFSQDAIEEINARFKQAGIGFEYNEEIIRIDSEFLHSEAVKPALMLLRESGYTGADEEFRSAFEHYRHGKAKEALTDALKALESTMKVICSKRGWSFNPTDTAKPLIDVCMTKGLIPAYWQSHFSSLRSMLESSVPTARNKEGGHGQGIEIKTVPDYLASYVLHMTASTIVFLVNAEKALP